ncbi:MAG: DUF2281 domain-containing protein [Caldilineaceae bacterium]|nr:DUF2281 domain-containing protein [Caldilineaceae bacterium]
MTVLEALQQQVKQLSPAQQREVLDFAELLVQRVHQTEPEPIQLNWPKDRGHDRGDGPCPLGRQGRWRGAFVGLTLAYGRLCLSVILRPRPDAHAFAV